VRERPRRWNNAHAAYLIGVPSPSFYQKTVYTYPASLDLNKVSFDVDTKASGANPRFGVFFQPNVGARFSVHMLLEFPDFEIVSFPGRATTRDRTPEPTVVCKLQLAHMMESEELSVFQKHEATSLFRVLNHLRENFLARAQVLYPEATFQLPNLLSQDGTLSIAIDTPRASRREAAQNRQAELLASYQDLGDKLFVFASDSPGSFRSARKRGFSTWV
jgi:hypothetical protein